MKLQTQIPLNKTHNQIDYESRLLLLGSCFSQNIGDKLSYYKFRPVQNPFGILFQPLAIEKLVDRAVKQKLYEEQEVFESNERWHAFDAHSELSTTSKSEILQNLKNGLNETKGQIERCTHVIITLGTAWVYRYIETDAVVANCHKIPQKEFEKRLLTITEITNSLERTIKNIQSINKNTRIIFTISPVRHLKDGFVENQRSKAHLISAIHDALNISDFAPFTSYFESYELMMDELRDYRFYAKDMVHPNELAIDYIWDKFKEVWISQDVHQTMDKVDDIQKGLRHRAFHPESEQHQKFRKSLQAKIAYIQKEYSFMEFDI